MARARRLAAPLFALVSLFALAACSGSDGAPIDPGDGTRGPTPGSVPAPDAGSPSPREDGGARAIDAAVPDAPSPAPSNDAGARDASPRPPAATTELAPYFPTWAWETGGYAYASLVDLQKKTGLGAVTIAFVLSGGGCKADDGVEQHLADVKAFVAAGGHVKASFGGADGTYVESQCKDAASLAKALEDFVDATGITDLDFDVEQDPVMTEAVNQMRGEALKSVQDAKGVSVAFTLAANPHESGAQGGLTSAGESVVRHAVAAGVKLRHVNLMTMDYGSAYAGKALAPVAIGSLTDANAQLVALVPGLSQSDAWAMLGVIPMIGRNDDPEVFSLADAQSVAAFAKAQKLGLVSFWSIDRDRVCPQGGDYNTCSTVQQTDFAFTKAFQAAL